MAKHALIIVYDGIYPEPRIQKLATQVIAEYGVIHDLDKISVYVLDEQSIVQAIAGKALTNDDNPNVIVPIPEEWALSVVYNSFKEAINMANYEEFSTAFAIKLAIEMPNNTDFVKAVRLLYKENSEQAISEAVRVKYHFSKQLFSSIRKTFNLVCQGRHVIIQ